MKLTTFLITVCFLQVNASAFSQKISLKRSNSSVSDIFREIKKQTGYDVFYLNDVLSAERKINANFKEASLTEVMNICLQGTGLEYTIDEKTIVIRREETTQLNERTQRSLTVQQTTVRGKVIDSTGVALPGASIRVLGTQNATTSDSDGEFTLSGVPVRSIISVSFVGYNTRNVRVSEANQYLNVVLSANSSTLEEVSVTVNTGYQKLPKERSAGSFSSISYKTLEQQRLSNIGSLLEGRIPGYNNGLIRGTSSMQGLTSPLYVIDGFPIEVSRFTSTGSRVFNLPDLNLEDIESITVLKDAAAASIYGARAANGVVVIETKKAKAGKTQISASSTITTSPYRYYSDRLTNAADIVEIEREWASKNPKLQTADPSAYAKSMLQNAVYQNQGIKSILNYYAGNITADQMNGTLDELAKGGYNYYNDMEEYAKRNPFLQQYNLSIATSNDKNAFVGSATYRNNKLEDKYSDNESLGINLKNSTKVNKWLSLDFSTFTQYTTGTTQTYNPLSPGYSYLPYDRLVNADGSFFTSTGASRLSQISLDNIYNKYGLYSMDITPLDEIGRNLDRVKNFTNRSNIRANIKFTDWLNYSAMFQYEYATDRTNRLNEKDSYYVRNRVNSFATGNATTGAVTYNLPYGNIYAVNNQFYNAYTFRQQLNFDKKFGDHSITAIAGTETRHNKIQQEGRTLYNYDPETLSFSMVNGQQLASAGGYLIGGSFLGSDLATDRERVNRFFSLYANAAYAYKEKYLLNASIRWDRSNLWATSSEYQSKPIWSTGIGWNIHKEDFFKVNWIDMLKLRASLGIGGNVYDDSAPYMTANYYANNNVGGIYGSIGRRPNPLLSWEKTTTQNIGLDYSVLNGRISGTIDYYNKKGENLLASTQGVPTEGYGYSTYTINNGEMTNKGLEISLSADVIRSRDIRWNATFMYARNKNKVTYVNVEAPVYYLQLDYPQSFPRIGNPYNSIYGYKWAGLSADGIAQAYLSDGSKTTSAPTNLTDIVYAGTTVPINSGSFNSLFSYKRFDLAFLLTFETGHKMTNTDLPMLGNAYNSAAAGYITTIGAVNKGITNRWRNPGDEAFTDIPRVVFAEDAAFNSNNTTLYQRADINVISAANLRMRNISLAYRLPDNWVRRARLANARLQFNMENVFTVAASSTAKYLLNGYQRPNYVMGLYVNF